MTDVRIEHNADEHRYEAWVGPRLVGRAEYRSEPGRVVYTHTEVDPDAEGQGIGSALVRAGLDDARRDHLSVVPVCPFVRTWIARHPEYRHLVAPG